MEVTGRYMVSKALCCFKVSLYFSALMLPSQKCKWHLPGALMQHRIITKHDILTCCWLLDDSPPSSYQIRSGLLIPLIIIHISTMWCCIPDASESCDVNGILKFRLLFCKKISEVWCGICECLSISYCWMMVLDVLVILEIKGVQVCGWNSSKFLESLNIMNCTRRNVQIFLRPSLESIVFKYFNDFSYIS